MHSFKIIDIDALDWFKYKMDQSMQSVLSEKVDKEDGKGLSSEDYTTTEKNKLAGIEAGALVNAITGVKGNAETNYRIGNVNITAANIGLGNVDNTSDQNKPISTATQTALNDKVDKVTGKGLSTEDFTSTYKTTIDNLSTNYAPLVGGVVPAANLPSYVDDVIEAATKEQFPAVGESGKIYVALDTNLTYRWGGTEYVEISKSLALGETASTAYAGNKGAANAAAITALSGQVSTIEGKIDAAVLFTQQTLTDAQKQLARTNINALDGGALTALVQRVDEVEEVSSNALCNLDNKITTNATYTATHVYNTDNPHNVTKAQLGLGNVDNTSDLNKPVSTATQTELDQKSEKVLISNETASTKLINPNTFYKWGTMTSLTITLATPTDNTIVNEYMFSFVSGSTKTILTLPSTIKGIDATAIEANKIYHVSIVDNIGVIYGVDNN